MDRELGRRFYIVSNSISLVESLASHRVRQLFDILPTAMKHGVTEVAPDIEPLRVSKTKSLSSGVLL